MVLGDIAMVTFWNLGTLLVVFGLSHARLTEKLSSQAQAQDGQVRQMGTIRNPYETLEIWWEANGIKGTAKANRRAIEMPAGDYRITFAVITEVDPLGRPWQILLEANKQNQAITVSNREAVSLRIGAPLKCTLKSGEYNRNLYDPRMKNGVPSTDPRIIKRTVTVYAALTDGWGNKIVEIRTPDRKPIAAPHLSISDRAGEIVGTTRLQLFCPTYPGGVASWTAPSNVHGTLTATVAYSVGPFKVNANEVSWASERPLGRFH